MHGIKQYRNFGLLYNIQHVKVLPETWQFVFLVYTDRAQFFSHAFRGVSWKYPDPILRKMLICKIYHDSFLICGFCTDHQHSKTHAQ